MSATCMEVRGPKLGDAASLWNFTPSPGWTTEQVAILRLALMKYGIGRWVQILDTGLLPGKLIQQLNGQTQRLLGQQSLAAYTGLHVDIDRIRSDNEDRKDAQRKGGLIIWSGPNPTKQMKADWQKEAQAKYGLSSEEILEAETALEELAARSHPKEADTVLPLVDSMEMSLEKLDRAEKIQLLTRLRKKLKSLVLSLEAPNAPIGAELVSASDANANGFQIPSRAHKKLLNGNKPATNSNKAVSIPTRKRRRKKESERDSSDPDVGDSEEDDTSLHESCLPKAAVDAAKVALESDIAQLQAMGFTKAKSAEALEECDNNVELALNWLINNCI